MMNTVANRTTRLLGTIARLPSVMRGPTISFLLARTVPFVGTAGIRVESVGVTEAVVRLPDRRRVRNHVGGVHAAATALLAENATGFVITLNLPDDRIPLLKTMRVDYVHRARGGLRARAWLTEDQRRLLLSAERGEVEVPVEVTGDSGEQPVHCTMVWAWTPRRRAET